LHLHILTQHKLAAVFLTDKKKKTICIVAQDDGAVSNKAMPRTKRHNHQINERDSFDDANET